MTSYMTMMLLQDVTDGNDPIMTSFNDNDPIK